MPTNEPDIIYDFIDALQEQGVPRGEQAWCEATLLYFVRWLRATHPDTAFPDEVEPDGLPNERNIPVSSLHFNIWYHLGLAYYVSGRFEDALRAYKACMEVSKIPDKIVATSHWLYMTLRLLGKGNEAAEVLEPIQEEMDVIENQNYHDCLLMYKGQTNVEALLEKAREQGALGLVTIGYGVASWYNYNGELEEAKETLREILDTGSWAGFGYIAAEADLKRLG